MDGQAGQTGRAGSWLRGFTNCQNQPELRRARAGTSLEKLKKELSSALKGKQEVGLVLQTQGDTIKKGPWGLDPSSEGSHICLCPWPAALTLAQACPSLFLMILLPPTPSTEWGTHSHLCPDSGATPHHPVTADKEDKGNLQMAPYLHSLTLSGDLEQGRPSSQSF